MSSFYYSSVLVTNKIVAFLIQENSPSLYACEQNRKKPSSCTLKYALLMNICLPFLKSVFLVESLNRNAPQRQPYFKLSVVSVVLRQAKTFGCAIL